MGNRVLIKGVCGCVYVFVRFPLPIFPHDQQAGLPASLAEALGEVSSYGSVAAEGAPCSPAQVVRNWKSAGEDAKLSNWLSYSKV